MKKLTLLIGLLMLAFIVTPVDAFQTYVYNSSAPGDCHDYQNAYINEGVPDGDGTNPQNYIGQNTDGTILSSVIKFNFSYLPKNIIIISANLTWTFINDPTGFIKNYLKNATVYEYNNFTWAGKTMTWNTFDKSVVGSLIDSFNVTNSYMHIWFNVSNAVANSYSSGDPAISFVLNMSEYYPATGDVYDIFGSIGYAPPSGYYGSVPTLTIVYENLSAQNLTNCDIGTKVLTFNIKAEEYPPTSIISDFAASFETWNDSSHISSSIIFNFSYSGQNSYNICIYPNLSKFYSDAIIEYKEPSNYSIRHYYLVNSTLSAATYNTIDLFLLNNTLSNLIKINVQTPEGLKIDDVIIKAQRFYIGDGLYKTVVIGKTNFDGYDNIYMRTNDVFYRFILEKDNVILRTFDPFKIIGSEITLSTSPPDLGDWFNYINKFAWYCDFNSATNVSSCTYSDTSGFSQQICYEVQKAGLINWTTMCDICDTSTSSTLPCFLGDIEGEKYFYTLKAILPNSEYTIEQNWLDFSFGNMWGTNGLLVAALIVIFCTFLGAYNPALSIALSMFGLLISYVFGLIDVGFGSIFSIIIVGAIIVYKMKAK